MPTQSESVQIRLNRSEALVLFEWLARFDESDGAMLPDQAEQQVLWKVEGQLESLLVEILSADYRDRVVEAKKLILGEEDRPNSAT